MVSEYLRPEIGGLERGTERLGAHLRLLGHPVRMITQRLPGTTAREHRCGIDVYRWNSTPGVPFTARAAAAGVVATADVVCLLGVGHDPQAAWWRPILDASLAPGGVRLLKVGTEGDIVLRGIPAATGSAVASSSTDRPSARSHRTPTRRTVGWKAMSAAEPVTDHPALSRRRELGATSARSLLLTILGEFVLPRTEPVWTRTLLDVLDGLGVEPKSARQALARTAAEGLLTSDRAGRRVRWSLTDPGRRLLSDGAARIYGFGAAAPPWDGRWLVLLVSVPEARRRLRHRLRTRLAWAGLGSPAPGVWLSPHPAKQGEVADVVADLELGDVTSSFVGTFGAIGEQSSVVAQAWDLAEVEATYEEFLDAFAGAAPSDPAEVLAHQIHLVHAWRRFPFLDPKLPSELLPQQWAGARAAELFDTLHGRWDRPAQQDWRRLVSSIR